ncbi:MAG: UDP-N-acetylmuramate--L-alanine ligase [Longimicrobiales bacterium]
MSTEKPGGALVGGVDVEDVLLTGTVHFMGVGGAGMAPLAELLLRSGGGVSGCDLSARAGIEALVELGLDFKEGHDPTHVGTASALVITAAVPEDHPELLAARERGIPILKRAEALGAWVNRGRVVALAGTHGKTTTTAITTHVLATAGLDPTGLVGGEVESWGGNLYLGNSDLFVVEADEYDRSFHTLRPHVAVVTNVEADHLDIYGDLEGVHASFETFVEGLRGGGTLWICGDDGGAAQVGVVGGRPTRSYGLSAGCQLRATEVEWGVPGSRFQIEEEGIVRARLTLPLPGVHNVRNALAAAGVARSLGAEWADIAAGLESFPGVGRRFQVLDTVGGVRVIDDYAHHPTEIAATLDAARLAHPGQRLVAVFQPHLFTRTRDFATEFGTALGAADRVWVTDIYPAREAPLPGVSGELVFEAVPRNKALPTYHSEFATLASAVVEDLKSGDVCVVMGAGSIEATGPEIVRQLETRQSDG